MATIFEADFRKGSLKDRVSGTVPTNTNAVISQQEKGRSIKTGSGEYLEYNVAIYSEAFGFACMLKPHGTISVVGGIIAVTGPSGERNELIIDDSFRPSIVTGVDGNRYRTLSTLKQDCPVLVLVDFDGTSTQRIYIDNTLVTSSYLSTGNVGGKSSVVRCGSLGFLDSPLSFFLDGYITSFVVSNAPFSSAERDEIYQEFLASTHITKPIVIKSGDATDMIVDLDGTNWNADGGTTNASTGNLEIATGAFRCLEDATGKYIECTTNGTLTLSGIDLSIFTGNGYLKEVSGDLSGDQGGTVDAASAFAFDTKLTITMTANQKLRGFTITASA